MKLSYILPLKWDGDQDRAEMTHYLETIAPDVELLIVDGSSTENFERHRRLWARLGRHIAPHADLDFINGKVNGVTTGFREAGHEKLIIADDDVRYTAGQLREIELELDTCHLLVPQNYFDPLPWHAKWDTSRSLLNRAFAYDFPGTLALQTNFVRDIGGYDGDVLFENLELIRTVKAANGVVRQRPGLYIRRVPPSTRHFWSQRVRQAFDDYAQPARLFFFLLFLPGIFLLSVFSLWLLPVMAIFAMLVAEYGRIKWSGSSVFPPVCSLFAPIWLLERGICTWLALFQRLLHGGVKYNNRLIRIAANPMSRLVRKVAFRQV